MLLFHAILSLTFLLSIVSLLVVEVPLLLLKFLYCAVVLSFTRLRVLSRCESFLSQQLHAQIILFQL